MSALHLYDVANVAGVAADLSHVNSNAVVRGFHGPTELSAALAGADLVVIPAGVPRKPGLTRDDLFAINAGIVRDLASAAADACPNAILNIISNPVNSTVPIAAEVLRRKGRYDPRRLMGVTHLDVIAENARFGQGTPTLAVGASSSEDTRASRSSHYCPRCARACDSRTTKLRG